MFLRHKVLLAFFLFSFCFLQIRSPVSADWATDGSNLIYSTTTSTDTQVLANEYGYGVTSLANSYALNLAQPTYFSSIPSWGSLKTYLTVTGTNVQISSGFGWSPIITHYIGIGYSKKIATYSGFTVTITDIMPRGHPFVVRDITVQNAGASRDLTFTMANGLPQAIDSFDGATNTYYSHSTSYDNLFWSASVAYTSKTDSAYTITRTYGSGETYNFRIVAGGITDSNANPKYTNYNLVSGLSTAKTSATFVSDEISYWQTQTNIFAINTPSTDINNQAKFSTYYVLSLKGKDFRNNRTYFTHGAINYYWGSTLHQSRPQQIMEMLMGSSATTKDELTDWASMQKSDGSISKRPLSYQYETYHDYYQGSQFIVELYNYIAHSGDSSILDLTVSPDSLLVTNGDVGINDTMLNKAKAVADYTISNYFNGVVRFEDWHDGFSVNYLDAVAVSEGSMAFYQALNDLADLLDLHGNSADATTYRNNAVTLKSIIESKFSQTINSYPFILRTDGQGYDGIIRLKNYAIDSDTNTRWVAATVPSTSAPNWLDFDLMGSTATISQYYFKGYSSTYYPQDFKLQQYSNGTWTDISGTSVSGNTDITKTVTFPAVTVSRVRFVVTKHAGANSKTAILDFSIPGITDLSQVPYKIYGRYLDSSQTLHYGTLDSAWSDVQFWSVLSGINTDPTTLRYVKNYRFDNAEGVYIDNEKGFWQNAWDEKSFEYALAELKLGYPDNAADALLIPKIFSHQYKTQYIESHRLYGGRAPYPVVSANADLIQLLIEGYLGVQPQLNGDLKISPNYPSSWSSQFSANFYFKGNLYSLAVTPGTSTSLTTSNNNVVSINNNTGFTLTSDSTSSVVIKATSNGTITVTFADSTQRTQPVLSGNSYTIYKDITPSTISSPLPCSDAFPGTKAPWLYGAIPQGSSSILLYFTEADNPVDHYALEYGTKSGNYQFGATNIGGKGTRTYLVKALNPSTTYYFRVRGGNGCATGGWSNEMSAKTKGLVSFNQSDITQLELESQPKEPSFAKTTEGKVDETQVESQNGYDVKVKVVDTNKKPVEGAKVTLHSKVQEAITNKEGIAEFKGVEPGEHKFLIAYKGFEGEQAVNLTGDVKEFNLNITVQKKVFSLSPLTYGIIIVMALVILALVILLTKNRQRRI